MTLFIYFFFFEKLWPSFLEDKQLQHDEPSHIFFDLPLFP